MSGKLSIDEANPKFGVNSIKAWFRLKQTSKGFYLKKVGDPNEDKVNERCLHVWQRGIHSANLLGVECLICQWTCAIKREALLFKCVAELSDVPDVVKKVNPYIHHTPAVMYCKL